MKSIREKILNDIANNYFENFADGICEDTFDTSEEAKSYAKELFELGKEFNSEYNFYVYKIEEDSYFIDTEIREDFEDPIIKFEN